MKKHLTKLVSKIFLKLKKTHQLHQYNQYREKYNLDKSFKFNGDGIIFYGDGKIEIAENTYIGQFSTIQSTVNCYVKIGKNCAISHYVKIYTSSNNPDQDLNHNQQKEKITGSISIGDGVWIGANVFINPGIIIGNNSIIGANSVVTKNVLDNSIVGGVPAKFIRMKNV